MFKFKFIMDLFQSEIMTGPYVEANIRAKWLTRLCPPDLKIAFAPNKGQVPLYNSNPIIIEKNRLGWWNHYVQNYTADFVLRKKDGGNWSLGPNIDLSIPLGKEVPMMVSSNFQKGFILDNINYPADLIHVIPNIIDSDLFFPRPKANQMTVGWIGHDVGQLLKGPEVIPFLARKFPEVNFEMIHSAKPAFQNEWLKEELPNIKIMYGISHYDMPKIVGRWHAMICGSKTENCPNQIIEAMGCGVPVIAAALDGIPEVAKTQILLPDMKWETPSQGDRFNRWTTESLENFAAALEDLLHEQEKLEFYREMALTESKNFSPQVIAQKWFEFMYFCRDRYGGNDSVKPQKKKI